MTALVAPPTDEERKRELPEPGHQGHRYHVRMMLNAAMRHLRDCEDYARLVQGNEPLAMRVRSLHEQLTEDVMNGKTTVPTRPELLARAERFEDFEKFMEAG